MLLQALMIIGTTLVLAGTILLGSLASAKSSFQALVARKADGASADGTARFVAWAQDVMAQNAAVGGNAWPRGLATPIREPICDPSPASSLAPCPLLATISWTVTGTSDPSEPAPYWSDRSTIDNPSVNLDEERISATLVVEVANSDALHPLIYAVRTLKITARTLKAPPYVVLTAVNDLASKDTASAHSEGDTGGYKGYEVLQEGSELKPDTARPAAFTTTAVRASINCENSAGVSESDPSANNNVLDLKRVRDYGNSDWSFEVPCSPKYQIGLNLPYASWKPPSESTFTEDTNTAKSWFKLNQSTNVFYR